MNFVTPLAFGLTSLIPVIVALYFLKLRRQEQTVSSVYLWRETIRDVAANAPWQRLRPNLLLLLQLLFLAALILALARPFSWTRSVAGDHLILVVDTSASMAASDVGSSRLSEAAKEARRLVSGLPSDVPVTLIAVGDQVEVLLSASADRGRLNQTLDGLRPSSGGVDMATALELAAAVAAGEPEAQVVVLSDGGVRLPDRLAIAAETRYLPIGESADNQAISALSLDLGAALTGFVRVSNYGSEAVQRRLTLYAYTEPFDRSAGQLVAVRDLDLPADDAIALTLPDLPPDTAVLEARLEGQDALALDDHAWAVRPVDAGAQIQVVGPGNRFLEIALALLPGVEVTTISLEDYEATWSDADQTAGQLTDQPANWLTVFDGVLPEPGHYPLGALLFLGPLRSTEFFSVTGALEGPTPLPASASEPLLRYVDLRDVLVQRSARLSLPAWGRPVVVTADGQEDAPLLVAGEVDGRRLAVLAFDLRQSDLALRVAFPLLLANLVDFLAPSSRGAFLGTVPPGQPLSVMLPPQTEALVVTQPDGTSVRLIPESGAALFEDTTTLGVYQVNWQVEGERWLLGRFAVNAFNPLESNIRPRPELALSGAAEGGITADRPVRQEWWAWLAWAALALLMLEWLVQYRGGVAWLWARTVTRDS